MHNKSRKLHVSGKIQFGLLESNGLLGINELDESKSYSINFPNLKSVSFFMELTFTHCHYIKKIVFLHEKKKKNSK